MKAKRLKDIVNSLPDDVHLGFDLANPEEAKEILNEDTDGVILTIDKVEWLGIDHKEDELCIIHLRCVVA